MNKTKNETAFNFNNSYASLPSVFYSNTSPATTKNPKMFLFNDKLRHELDLEKKPDAEFALILSGNELPDNAEPLAQAYAGHQFGHLNKPRLIYNMYV